MARHRELIKQTILHRRVRPGVAVTTTIRGASGKFAFASFRDAMASRMVQGGRDHHHDVNVACELELKTETAFYRYHFE